MTYVKIQVISVLPSLLVALTESASAEELTELLESSGRNKRLYEMLVYVGLQDNLEPAGDSEHTTDFSRFAAIMNFIRVKLTLCLNSLTTFF